LDKRSPPPRSRRLQRRFRYHASAFAKGARILTEEQRAAWSSMASSLLGAHSLRLIRLHTSHPTKQAPNWLTDRFVLALLATAGFVLLLAAANGANPCCSCAWQIDRKRSPCAPLSGGSSEGQILHWFHVCSMFGSIDSRIC